MLTLIIDGYNLIRQIPALEAKERESLEAGRQTLIAKLGRYRKFKPHKVTVVFDGVGGMGEGASVYKEAGVGVCFSSERHGADGVIKNLAKVLGAKAIVVSSDRSVADFAKGCGCAVIDSVAFYEKLAFAELAEIKGVVAETDGQKRPQHKRWMTYKKGPERKLPKKQRRNKKKLEKL
jgi:predicted RNA-binding protein with PIN domain